MNNKIILDVDGVLLNYEEGFIEHFGLDSKSIASTYENFTDQFGLEDSVILDMVFNFNDHVAFSKLKPFVGAKESLDKLKAKGYSLSIISSCGSDIKTHEMRKENLISVFGDIFDDLELIAIRESKKKYLKKHQDSKAIWIDDSYSHYKDGQLLGLDSIWKTTIYNQHQQKRKKGENCIGSWENIMNYIQEKEKIVLGF